MFERSFTKKKMQINCIDAVNCKELQRILLFCWFGCAMPEGGLLLNCIDKRRPFSYRRCSIKLSSALRKSDTTLPNDGQGCQWLEFCSIWFQTNRLHFYRAHSGRTAPNTIWLHFLHHTETIQSNNGISFERFTVNWTVMGNGRMSFVNAAAVEIVRF